MGSRNSPAKMQKLPPESWCDHEFIVLKNKSATTDKHVIALYDAEDAVIDEVFAGTGKLVRRSVRINHAKETEEYNSHGQVSLTRTWSEGPHNTIVCHERAAGSIRSERVRTYTIDGRPLSNLEKFYRGSVVHSEAETRFDANSTPCSTATRIFDPSGRIQRLEVVSWYADGKPAMTELAEFDGTGQTNLFRKTMHDQNGSALWQETNYFPENEPKPNKKELIVFQDKALNQGIVEISELRQDGSVINQVMTMLGDAANSVSEKKTTGVKHELVDRTLIISV
jgi:hypothetical protein